MFVAYFAPWAPVAILLLSAFILSSVDSWLPVRWRTQVQVQYFLGPGLVGLALLSLLILRITDNNFKITATTLSGWPFSTSNSLLSFSADGLSLSFLFLILITLLIVALLSSPFNHLPETEPALTTLAHQHWRKVTGWLLIGASLCLLVVSANILTLTYTLLVVDIMLMGYWLRQGVYNLAVARLFLGVFSASAFTLIEFAPLQGVISGGLLLGIALWLRMALFPLMELTEQTYRQPDNLLAYLALSLIAAIYLLSKGLNEPWPSLVLWLTVVTVIILGWQSWRTKYTPVALIYLFLAELALLFLVMPAPSGIIVSLALALGLSLLALWAATDLNRPNFDHIIQLWPYLPPLLATLTLIGLPFSLGWFMHTFTYHSLLSSNRWLMMGLVLLAQMLGFSALARYWLTLWHDNHIEREYSRPTTIGFIATIPFLIPGAAPYILPQITNLALPVSDFTGSGVAVMLLFFMLLGAVALEYFRDSLTDRLHLHVIHEFLDLPWVWHQSKLGLERFGKILLRVEIIIEGQHYIGWAVFAALVGAVIILFRT